MLMWQMFSREEPFKSITDRNALSCAIRYRHLPTLPENAPLPLKELMTRCWTLEPKGRPKFQEIETIIKALVPKT